MFVAQVRHGCWRLAAGSSFGHASTSNAPSHRPASSVLSCFAPQGSGSRDVVLLDIALDNWFRTLLERQDRSSLDGDALVELIGLALDNAVIAGESQEIAQVSEHHNRTHAWPLFRRLGLAVGCYTVRLGTAQLLQPVLGGALLHDVCWQQPPPSRLMSIISFV